VDKIKAESFKNKLAKYQELIDVEIADFIAKNRKTTASNYGEYSSQAMNSYYDVLQRGGKRVRGALCILGYEMLGGKDQKMIIKAARILEMIHAYILIIDDINDASETRRGKLSAHKMIESEHKKASFFGDAAHFGESIAMNAALVGGHMAQSELAIMEIEPELKIKAMGILNYSMMVTGHGQLNDMYNEVIPEVRAEMIDKVLEWKTAHYTFLNPLTFGMVLAGAGCADTDAIAGYAMSSGRVFQITDDILGTFGEEFASGKSPMDDTREGKRTVLSMYALEHASKADEYFLLSALGNHHLTRADFERVKEIILETGAYEHANNLAKTHASEALSFLEIASKSRKWDVESVSFLHDLTAYLIGRSK
jgi:geranylgeranyl diphosphate synthase, type I